MKIIKIIIITLLLYINTFSQVFIGTYETRPIIKQISKNMELNFFKSFNYKPVDGRKLGTLPNGYIYFKDKYGKKHQGIIILDYKYFLIDNDWKKIYPLYEIVAKYFRRLNEK